MCIGCSKSMGVFATCIPSCLVLVSLKDSLPVPALKKCQALLKLTFKNLMSSLATTAGRYKIQRIPPEWRLRLTKRESARQKQQNDERRH